MAVLKLQQLGQPPPEWPLVDEERLTKNIRDAIIVIAGFSRGGLWDFGSSLGHRAHIQHNWEALHPWITFLIQHVLLSDRAPSTAEDAELHDFFACSAPSLVSNHIRAFVHWPTSFNALIPQVWAKLIAQPDGKRHTSAEIWGSIWLDLYDHPGPAGLELQADGLDMTSAIRTFLRTRTKMIPGMDGRDLVSVRYIADILLRSQQQQYAKPSRELTRPMARCLSALLSKRVISQRDVLSALKTANRMLGFLEVVTTDSAWWMIRMLKTRIVNAIFRAPACFFRATHGCGTEGVTFSDTVNRIFRRLGDFLYYPRVQKTFSRVVKDIGRKGGLEEGMRAKSETLLTSWMALKEKAIVLGQLRNELRDEIRLGQCYNDNVRRFFFDSFRSYDAEYYFPVS